MGGLVLPRAISFPQCYLKPLRVAPVQGLRNDKVSGAAPVVIAINGSCAFCASPHPLGKALLAEGIGVCVPDVRRHGETGRHGDHPIHAVRADVPVTVLPDPDHVQVSTDPRAVPAIIGAIRGGR